MVVALLFDGTRPSKQKARRKRRAFLSSNQNWQQALSPETSHADLSHLEIFRRFLAAICDDFVLNVLAFVESAQSGALDGRDVNEHILATALRLDEAIALGRVEPLHSACSHYQSPSLKKNKSSDVRRTHECRADIAFGRPIHTPNRRVPLPRVATASNSRKIPPCLNTDHPPASRPRAKTAWDARPAHICCSTSTTPWPGGPGVRTR